jgi:O-antigen ligase
MIIFILGSTFSSQNAWIMLALRVSGILLVAINLTYLRKTPIAPEVYFYGGFVAWGVVSGLIVARDYAAFLNMVLLLSQIFLLVYAVSGFVYRWRDPDLPFFGMIICALVLSIYGTATGMIYQSINAANYYRYSAYLTNPNTLAQYALLAIMGSMLFWHKAKKLRRVILMVLVASLTFVIVFSGSRKAFLGLLLFWVVWGWFCYRHTFLKHPARILFALAFLLAVYFLVDYVWESTYMGYRLQVTFAGQNFFGDARTTMYEEGWKLFYENPIAGIGMGNYRVYSSLDAYSHSDYMEVLASTGVVGFLLYFSIYFVLIKRLLQLRKMNISEAAIYKFGVLLAYLIVLLTVATGRINSQSIIIMFTLAAAIGYTYEFEHRTRRRGTSVIKTMPAKNVAFIKQE